ncbi:Hypothetical protein NTJ_02466 [Nesidiocoris tenuis]|uniref:Gustatory receptor n=1 Tax=Nesidiocoris tenuis TaxID=355587 RepID=A0ABN7AE71_9HEMI|nr:Hypothetical protein NTJ_02466 [Nesidiocoris tenuis]
MKLLGLLFYDENGRAFKCWYPINLLYFSILVPSIVYYYSSIVFSKRNNYFTSRPFHAIVTVMISVLAVASRVCQAVRLRFPLTHGDIVHVETFFSDSIEYSVTCFDVFIIYIPFVKVILYGSTTVALITKNVFTAFDMVARAIRRSKADRLTLAALHSHLYYCCTAFHDFFRYQLALEFLKNVLVLVWSSMYLHERILGLFEGKYSLAVIIHPLLEIVFIVAELGCFSSAYQGLKDEVDGFVIDTNVILVKEKKRNPDRALLAYVSLCPKMNLSMSGFFIPTRVFIVSVLSSTCLNYMLMVQMGVLRSSFL